MRSVRAVAVMLLIFGASASAARAADITGTWNLPGGSVAPQTWNITTGTGNLAGEGHGGPYTWPIEGTLSGDAVQIKTAYRETSYTAYFVGTVSSDGATMSGTWDTGSYANAQSSSNTWTANREGGAPGGGGGTPPPDSTPPGDSPPGSTPATARDMRGSWLTVTKAEGSASASYLHETYTSMDLGSGAYSGRGQGGKYSWPTSGRVEGNTVRFVSGPYDQTQYGVQFTGTFTGDGSIAGTFVDSFGQKGTFTQTRTDSDPPPPGAFPPRAAYQGNWALDTYDASGQVRYSRSAITLNGERGPPVQAFLGFGSNLPYLIGEVELRVGGTAVDMRLRRFSFNSGYGMRFVGERINENAIAGAWADATEEGQFVMTRSATPAVTSGNLVPGLRPRPRTAGGGGVLEVTPPISCVLSASSAGVYPRAVASSAAKRKKPRKKLSGIRVPRFGPVFVSAGQLVRIPVRPVAKRKRGAKARAADGQRTQVSMTVTCDPASSPTDDDPPPAEPSDPIKSKIDVPANVDASGPADAKRLKAGLWVGTPIGGGPGGITFSVAPSGAIIDEQGGQPLTARAPQQCGSAQGLIASGLGKVTLLHSLTAAPAGSYPREARYLKQNIASNGGVGGQINLVLSFHGDDSGTATLSAAQPARPLSFSCLIPAQSFAIRHSASPNPPAATNDGLPYETGESGATQPGPLRATTTTLACNRGPLPTSDATCEATVIDSDKGVLTLPAGTVKWTLERGSLPNGDTCKLIPHPYSASMARCSIVYRPDAAGIPAATRIPVTAKYEGSTQHARSEATTEGIDPLTIVCVGLWSNDCEGKVPKPAPVETCVAAWQQCEGFKGSKNTGALDISGLPDKSPEAGSTKTPPFQFRPPQEVKAPIECDDEEPGDGDPSGTCVISTSVSGAIEEFASAATGDAKRDAERNARIQEFARDVLSLAKAKSTGSSKDDDKQLAAFKKVVEKAFSEPVDPNRTITPHPARAKLEAEKEWIRKKLAYMEQHFGPNAAIAQRESFARFLAAAAELFNRKTATLILRGGSDALDEGTQKAIDEFARSRFDIVRKAYDDFPTEPINQAPRELFNGESDCARTFASDAQVRAACLTFLAQVNAAVIRDRQAVRESTTKAIKELQRRVLTTQMGAVGRSLLHARRRTPFVFASGVTQIPVGKSGKLKLRFPPEAQGVLKMLRLLGATSITTTVTTTTVRAGIRTTTSRKVRLKLG